MVFRHRTQTPKPLKQASVTDLTDDDYNDAYCEQCGSDDYPAELLLCDRGFHLFCLRPILVSVPKGSWFCPPCYIARNSAVFLWFKPKLLNFFTFKGRRLLGNPEAKPSQYCYHIVGDSLDRMILNYMPGMAPRSSICADLERGGMQVLSKEDTETLNLRKNMMERGEWPPLMVVFDPQEGFIILVDRFIYDLTIITEYAGDVDYFQNHENDAGDSMMTLVSPNDPLKSLVICPDKRGNIARFINGINNHKPDGKNNQNLKCVRFDVNGEYRVLLIAYMDIPKGERLYYDYYGYGHEYPTEHFV